MPTPDRIDSHTAGDPASRLGMADLEARLAQLTASPRDLSSISLLVRRGEGGLRDVIVSGRLSAEAGLVGDEWVRKAERSPDAQLTMMEFQVAQLIANGQSLGLFGDQLFAGLDLSRENLPAGSQLEVGAAVLEVTGKPHNGCQKFRSRFGADALRFVSRPDLRPRNFRGIYLRVLRDGGVAVGDSVTVTHRPEEDPS